jgi:hypothetical protein
LRLPAERADVFINRKGSLEADTLMRRQSQRTSLRLNKDPFNRFKQPPIKLIRKIVITSGASLSSKSGLAGDPRGN